MISPEFAAHVDRQFGAAGREWLRSLPALIHDLERRWSIDTGGPIGTGVMSIVLSAETVPGMRKVALKLTFLDVENRLEVAALRAYDGDGAVGLLEADEERGALMLEWLDPEWSLLGLEEIEACRIAARLARRLWKAAPADVAFDRLDLEGTRWAADLVERNAAAGSPVQPRVVEEAVELLPWLIESSPPTRLLHRDLHHGNVLAGRREPWLVIDPKPIVGDPAFDLAAMLRGRLGEPADRMERRFRLLCAETGLDPVRVRGWALAKTIAWGLGGGEHQTWELAMAGAIAELRP